MTPEFRRQFDFARDPDAARNALGIQRWSLVRAAANANSVGSLLASYNVTSINHSGSGAYDVTLASRMSSSNYVVIPSIEHNAVLIAQLTAGKTDSTFSIRINNAAGTATDASRVSFIVLGN